LYVFVVFIAQENSRDVINQLMECFELGGELSSLDKNKIDIPAVLNREIEPKPELSGFALFKRLKLNKI